jgi:hypothetical protein
MAFENRSSLSSNFGSGISKPLELILPLLADFGLTLSKSNYTNVLNREGLHYLLRNLGQAITKRGWQWTWFLVTRNLCLRVYRVQATMDWSGQVSVTRFTLTLLVTLSGKWLKTRTSLEPIGTS